ncbi:MAG TPA: hypothetical protein PK866_15545, partial [Nitrospira sp.]|nr:hypothetical protein [Nitrospira sp.]
MAEITIYQKPTCSTCREAVRLVRESGQPFTAVNQFGGIAMPGGEPQLRHQTLMLPEADPGCIVRVRLR